MDPQVDGLILYKFRVQFAIDPGPFITKAVIALAIVAAIEGGAAACRARRARRWAAA